jgi:acyl-CoA reductase-like NAD-dependent aldehyde dehydrogenase
LALTFDLAADLCEGYGMGEVDLSYDPRGPDYSARVERFPVGPVLGIVPYNWPLNLAAHKVAPALAVGCTIVLKASSQAPLSTLALGRLIHEAGCPPGVVNTVVCPSPIAEKMALDSRIAKVSFTGSPQVGWALKERLPGKKVTLELGGDASAIVMPDADLEWATKRIVAGKFGYAGQICISVQHARVHEDVYDQMRARLTEATVECPSGDPMDPQVVCGPLISDSAADRVMEWISEAVAGGAKLLAGGTRSGRVVAPTLLENVPPHSKLGCEEVFGPVLTLSRFSSLDQAIEDVNSSRYGIHCGVFTRDPVVADRCFRELEVGGVVIDDYPTLRFDALPYGGVKESGFGREGVAYAMDEMTEPKSLVRRL